MYGYVFVWYVMLRCLQASSLPWEYSIMPNKVLCVLVNIIIVVNIYSYVEQLLFIDY